MACRSIAVLCYFIIWSTECGCLTVSPNPPVRELGSDPNSITSFGSLICFISNATDISNIEVRWGLPDISYVNTSTNSETRFTVSIYTNNADDMNTNVTTLGIGHLSYLDNGTYTCEVRDIGSNHDEWISASIDLILLVHLDSTDTSTLTVTNESIVELSCDMAGYIPEQSNLMWYKDNTIIQPSTDDNRIIITYTNGTRASQPGGKDSILSILSFSPPIKSDSGIYECRINGYEFLPKQSVELIVMLLSDSTSSSQSIVMVTSTTTMGTTGSPTSSSPATGSNNNNNDLLTIVIAAIAGFLGFIVLILMIVIIIVACQRCRQSEIVIQDPARPTVTVSTVKDHTDVHEHPPPIPTRSFSSSSANKNIGPHAHHANTAMPDLIQTQSLNQSHPPLPQKHYHAASAETKFISSFPYNNDDHPRVIPPDKSPQVSKKSSRGTYYDTVNLLQADNRLPGASGFSLANVPSPHDVLSGSLQRQNPPDFSYPIYNDGFTHDDLATYDTVDQDYDQIYSEPIEPEMLSTGENTLAHNEGLPYSAVYDDPHPLSQKDTPLEVVPANIIEIKKLGTGQFGQVILARTKNLSLVDMKLSESNGDRAHSILVAVKKLKDNAETGLFEAFEKEVKFMTRLNHDNVVKLLGVCRVGENFIMMEYMENGDLNQFLQRHALVPDTVDGLGEWEITPIILLYIGVQIASGLHYLSSRKFVHRDLATRNCLVGRDFIVKISDFGMSRKLYESAYYRVQGTLVLPIRWMSCETFYGKFSVKSDAWAFGVTLWELYTLAKCDPYDDLTDEEVIQDAIRGPNRKLLPRPEICPPEVYDVMLRCWIHEPAMRADFGEIYSRLYMCYTSQASL